MRQLPKDTYWQVVAPKDYRKMWGVLRYGLLMSVPPTVGGGLDALRKVLVQLLCGRAQAWVLYKKEAKQMQMMMVTYLDSDPLTKAKYMIIYAVYAYAKVEDEAWLAVADRLDEFARGEGCERIIAFTAVDRIIEMATAAGFADQYHLIAKEL